MLEEAMGVHGIPEAIHADRGTSMTSKPVAQLLLDLGVDRSHSRPRVSNDNPYSEAAFKTLKYAPVFPEAFGSLADTRASWCQTARESQTPRPVTALGTRRATWKERCFDRPISGLGSGQGTAVERTPWRTAAGR